MNEALALADDRILLALNHALAPHPRLYVAGLWITDEISDGCFFLTVAMLWFWRERQRSLLAPDAYGVLSRTESRARLMVLGAAGMAAYVTTRLIALGVDRPRPFVTYLPVLGVPGAFEGLRTFGAFPSDHAALLGALPIGFACWSRGLAVLWTVLAVFFGLTRIAVGFHYPSDMLVGAIIGMTYAWLFMRLYDRWDLLETVSNAVASAFARPPVSYALYGLLVLGALEFAMHFKHVLAVILFLRGQLG